MISVDNAISRFRRDLLVAGIVRVALLAAAVFCLVAAPALPVAGNGVLVVVGIAVVWIVLSYRNARGSRVAAQWPMLIAAGQYDQAERQIEHALDHFSLFRAAKMLSLHHLALLRHAQKRWRDASLLCQALLSQKRLSSGPLARSTRLLLADAALQLGDLGGAYAAMAGLYQQRLSLSEALTLQLLQLEYQARLGAWEQMLAGVATRIQLAELMPCREAARCQWLLGLAARKMGRRELSEWLNRRCRLLAQPEQFLAERPGLKALSP